MDDLEAAFALGAGVAARPHQLGAVRKVCAALCADCHLPRPSNYLVQHAAGSGKSLTIAALADALTRLEDERKRVSTQFSNDVSGVNEAIDRKVEDVASTSHGGRMLVRCTESSCSKAHEGMVYSVGFSADWVVLTDA